MRRLLVGKVALFLWLADEVIRRNPMGTKPLIFLSDGERALHDRQSEYLPENVICILDLFHVMERLWKAAWCFFEESTQKKEAHQWVGRSCGCSWKGRWRGDQRVASDDDEAAVEGDASPDDAG